jgi:hypothetical protein
MNDQQPLSLRGQSFGGLDDGHEVQLFTLARSGGAEVSILTYGGIIQSIRVPDRTGQPENVVLGFDELDAYVAAGNTYFGAIVGRYANEAVRRANVAASIAVSLYGPATVPTSEQLRAALAADC